MPTSTLLRRQAEIALQRLSHLPKVFSLVWSASRKWTALWFILLLVTGVLPAANVYLSKVLVDRLYGAMGGGFSWDVVQWTLLPLGLMVCVLVLEQILSGLSGWVRAAQTEFVVDQIKALVHSKAVAVDLAFYDSAEYHDHLARANGQASSRTISVLQNMGMALQHAVTIISIAGLLLAYGFWVPLALLASALPAFFVVVRHNARVHEWWKETTETRRWTDYYDSVLTHRTTAPEVRLFELHGHFRAAYVDLRQALRSGQLRLIRSQTFAHAGAGLSALAVTGGTIGWMLWRAFRGMATLGDLALFYQAFSRGQALMRSMLSSVGTLYADILFLEHLFTFLQLESKVNSPAHPVAAPTPPRQHIRFKGVAFQYPGSRRRALEKFDLEIAAGTTVALVGPNGAGKSTLVNLLCRFYDPVEGSIEIDGIDLRKLDVHELRRMITVMFQYPTRWAAKARENITLGDLQRPSSHAAVEAAAEAAGAKGIVESLPAGYESLLGKQFASGVELSGGQWQRMSLARAFYRQAPIVVLDEPTSAMDSWEETQWLRRFRRLVNGRTALIITHRFTTAMHADIIHVVQDGRIAESGTHRELLLQNGLYARSWYEQTQLEENGGGADPALVEAQA